MSDLNPMNNPFRMHPQVEKTLSTAEKAIGKPVDLVACWKWLRELEDVAESFTRQHISGLCADIDAPVDAGGVLLYMPSPAALELCFRAEELESPYWRLVEFYVLSLGRDAFGLRRLFAMTDADLIAEAKTWANGLSCSFDALRTAADWIFNADVGSEEPNAKRKPKRPRSWDRVVSALMREYGGLPEVHWMYGVSVAEIRRRREAIDEREEADDAMRARIAGASVPVNANSHLSKMKRKYNALEKEFITWLLDDNGEKK